MKTRICPKCKEEKPLSEFYKCSQRKNGYGCYCIKCRSVKSQKTIEKEFERDKLFKQGLKYCPKCKEIKSLSKFGKSKNRKNGYNGHCKDCKKIYRIKNKDHKNKRERIWRSKNPEKAKIYRDKWKEKNPDYNKQYHKNRRENDIFYKIRVNLSSRVSSSVKNKYKSIPTMLLVGCSINYLRYYLQSQFKDGMTWDNYGLGLNGKGMKEWHIDHIKPCASFDLSKPEEQQKCFHYSNLQPLWAEENLRKSKKYNLFDKRKNNLQTIDNY